MDTAHRLGWRAGRGDRLPLPRHGCCRSGRLDLHSPNLSPGATVWCLSNPEHFGAAARAHGFKAETGKTSERFIRGQGEVFLDEWARSTEAQVSSEFERACEAAFAAFGNAGGEATSTSSDDSERAALIGVVVGGLLTALLGLLASHSRANREEAEELRGLDTAFQADLTRLLISPEEPGAKRGALVSARSLKHVLGEWIPGGVFGGLFGRARKGEIEGARTKLDEMLDDTRVPSLYRLKKEHDTPAMEDANIEALRADGQSVHRKVGDVARRVERFRRFAGRQLGSS